MLSKDGKLIQTLNPSRGSITISINCPEFNIRNIWITAFFNLLNMKVMFAEYCKGFSSANFNTSIRNIHYRLGEFYPTIKAFTCGNLVTTLPGLSQVPQDVVWVHVHQPTNQPQHRAFEEKKKSNLLQLTKGQSVILCFCGEKQTFHKYNEHITHVQGFWLYYAC